MKTLEQMLAEASVFGSVQENETERLLTEAEEIPIEDLPENVLKISHKVFKSTLSKISSAFETMGGGYIVLGKIYTKNKQPTRFNSDIFKFLSSKDVIWVSGDNETVSIGFK